MRPRFGPLDAATLLALRIALTVYLGTFLLYVAALALLGRLSVGEVLQLGVPMIAGDCLLALPLWLVLRWSERWPIVRRVGTLAMGVIAVSAVQTLWDLTLRQRFGNLRLSFVSDWYAFVSTVLLNVAHNAMFVALLAFGAAYAGLRERQRELDEAREAERGARMEALRLQLNPHFLFNALNALSSLVVLDRKDEAEEMIARLAVFLRAVLEGGEDGLIPLSEEFDLLDAYLDVERIRFGDTLVVEMVLPPDLADVGIPPFLLQPAVENAIKYAVAPAREPVVVRITATRDVDAVALVVADDGGSPDVGGGTGLGLANIRRRLQLAFGSAASLETVRETDGFRVLLRIPA